jgi:hypothetical protein
MAYPKKGNEYDHKSFDSKPIIHVLNLTKKG